MDDYPQPRPAHHQSEGLRSIISTVAILLIAPLIAVVLTLFVFQSYQVSGQSMETTLHNNDRLIIWKAPRTWSRITGHPYIPKRGDIVVLSDANIARYGDNPQQQLIKRVVALPGERIVINNNTATVYNRDHPEGFQPDATLPYGESTPIPETTGNMDLVVPKGEVFVMGDNRDHSLDSRQLGTVPARNIVGKLIVRLLPVNQIQRF